ncbi:oxidoreductase [Curtobacterium sp. MCBA15_009]|uniref:FAD-binding oxidoreductase n=1 Tax=Curtobacterium sp. MCBA15_009 TaxID=1898737 RepID=UPI0008DD819B|nr:FAD-binding oxidoreductase [Curtobacterium sp. MCBA15_009]OII12750.1 oxidoreductase [Curtobacterium sp. MCBA15_009]
MTDPTPTLAPASRRRPAWYPATIAAVAPETPNARRIVLDVPGWPGSAPGQHVDVRLTAEDGYQASRSYSLASSGGAGTVVLAVDRVEDGEVSPFLVDAAEVGDAVEVQGPLGGWFVWRPGESTRPVQLIAGGSGIVPLAAIATAHADAADFTPFRLLVSVRTPEDLFFRDELERAAAVPTAPLDVTVVHSRRAPDGAVAPAGRLTRDRLAEAVFPPETGALVYVCGSTPFVEQVLQWLDELGHDTADVRAERFGGAG